MIQNKIVVRYQDGRVMKGVTNDFLPTKDVFHLVPMEAPVGAKPVLVSTKDLKAIFFVKDYSGNSAYQEKKQFDPDKPVAGRKIKVVFKDGELLLGTTQGYQPGRPGFFVVPSDAQSNSDRCFVFSAAASEVTFV